MIIVTKHFCLKKKKKHLLKKNLLTKNMNFFISKIINFFNCLLFPFIFFER